MSPTEKRYYSSKNWFPKRVACVIVDGDFIPVESIEVLNVEEDISGRDLLTFMWKDQEKQSFVVEKYV